MDPLTVALAVITLATAVKDLTELGTKIRESFAKVPKNLLNAKRVARDISEMLEDIVEFSEQNRETLENAQEFRTALQDLIKALRGFELSTLSLLQELKTCGRFSRMWTSWRKREEIEATVHQLRDAVKKVVKRHLMKGALRIELNTERIHHATSQIQRDITDLRATTTTLALTTFSSTPSSDNIDQSILILANTSSSTSVPMLRAPAVITDEIMSKAFVKFQVGSIVSILENLRDLPIEKNVGGGRGSDSDKSFQITIGTAEQQVMATTQLWYRAVQAVIHTRRLLDAWPLRTTIRAGAVYLADLVVTLQQLDLTDEQTTIGKWRVTLHRMLVSAEPDQSIYRVCLATALLSQAHCYIKIDKVLLAAEVSEEASKIARQLAYTKESQALLSAILADHSKIISETSGGSQLAMSLSMESVKIMEDVLDVRVIGCNSHIMEDDGSHSVNPIFIQRLFSAPSTRSFLSQYAGAQCCLGEHLSAERRLEEALKCMLLSITIFRRMLVEYDKSVRYELARTLYALVMSPTLALLNPEKQLHYVDEAIENRRNLFSKNPVFHGRQLVAVLCRKAALLYSMNKGQESADVCQEAVTLAHHVLRDDQLYANTLRRLSRQFRLLGRHNDAANTGMLVVEQHQSSTDAQVGVYHVLCSDLLRAGRVEDALRAAEKSVLFGRTLALKDAFRCTVVLLRSLCCLALCLSATGNQDSALQTGREILQIMDNLIKHASPLLQEQFLRHVSMFAFLLDGEQQSLAFMSDFCSLIQRLAVCNPENQQIVSRLLWCQLYQAQVLFRFHRPLQAQSHIEELLISWKDCPPNLGAKQLAYQNIATLNVLAEILHNLGQSDQALDVLRKAVKLAQPYLSMTGILYQVVQSTHWRIITTASLWVEYSSDIQKMAESVLKFARATTAIGSKALVTSLHSVGIVACHNRMYQRLVEASEESVDICRGDDDMSLRCFPNGAYPLDLSLVFLPKSMQLLSFGLANLGRLAEGIKYAKEAVEYSLKLKMTLTVASSLSTQSYIETRGNLANILIASGDIDEAVKILEERREYFSKRVEVRYGEYRDLVPTLHTLGILCCHLGRHEEGKAAAREFQHIMKTLSTVFSNLHSQVIVHLERDLDTPILQPLEDMRNNLKCNHQ